MTPQEILIEVNKIYGWFSTAEMNVVYNYVKSLKDDSLLVELGTYKGRSTLFFSLTNPKIQIITIDEVKKFWKQDLPAESIDPYVVERGKNIQYIIDNTSNVAKNFNRPIDFLFIDTLHTFDGVTRDLDDWAHFISEGGYILFHDYSDGHRGVIEGVEAWFKDKPEWEHINLSVPMHLVRKKLSSESK